MVWKWWSSQGKQDNNQQPQPKNWWPFKGKQTHNQPAETQSPQIETKSYFRSYSSSRTCKPDPEDANYMVCKEKINDGNNTYQKEQRVPINQSGSRMAFPVVGMRDFDDISSQFAQLDKEFSRVPFFGSIFTPLFKDFQEFTHLNPEAHYHQHQGSQTGHHQQAYPEQPRQQQQQANSRYYFNGSGERDFSIRDL